MVVWGRGEGLEAGDGVRGGGEGAEYKRVEKEEEKFQKFKIFNRSTVKKTLSRWVFVVFSQRLGVLGANKPPCSA